jgi:hypothetical protein
VDIIVLGCLIEFSGVGLVVDHASAHGNALLQDVIDKPVAVSLSHGIDTSFGQGQIDGSREVEECGRGVSEV